MVCSCSVLVELRSHEFLGLGDRVGIYLELHDLIIIWLTSGRSPINPARDVTGRIWLSILGYKNAWSAFDNYSWVGLFSPEYTSVPTESKIPSRSR